MSQNHLLLIDPQNDFADPAGSLCVPNAAEDMGRVASFINKNLNDLSHIHVTLDSHHLWHIAHPNFWVNDKGEHPAPFTQISFNDVRSGKWHATDGDNAFVEKYLTKLETAGKYKHTIWPPHCIMGEWGHGIYPQVTSALRNWVTAKDQRVINYVMKGSNSYTEHFSAIKAEVPMSSDNATSINHNLLDKLEKADVIYVAGIAGSHCVASTVRDLVKHINPFKIVLLIDAMSPVPGCEALQESFVSDMTNLCVSSTTTDIEDINV